MYSREPVVGISGFAAYVPRLRVDLKQWCRWTGADPGKISTVIGRSFRMMPPEMSVYTLAANAVLRLLRNYEIDATEICHLALGTESSTDNSAGAVIIKGMVNDALIAEGKAPIPRACEVPEVKQACLGGIYALKGAIRHIGTDGRGKKAIVVSADIAEYGRGTSGEPTQGCGAVALLIEENPSLLRLNLDNSGSASAYRGVDFRKPFGRHFVDGYAQGTRRPHDFPVFNGKYSTFCYTEATIRAIEEMFLRLGQQPRRYFDDVGLIFFHRPYHWMPVQALSRLYAWALSQHTEDLPRLAEFCQEADVDMESLAREIERPVDLFDHMNDCGPDVDPYPLVATVAKRCRKSADYLDRIEGKLTLGSDLMKDMGNLYSASLPAWIASGLEDAWAQDRDLAGQEILLVGYGSGDAAEAIPAQVAPGWKEAAARIGIKRALEGAVDLDEVSYQELHDHGRLPDGFEHRVGDEFIIADIGTRVSPPFEDVGVEYYRYVPA